MVPQIITVLHNRYWIFPNHWSTGIKKGSSIKWKGLTKQLLSKQQSHQQPYTHGWSGNMKTQQREMIGIVKQVQQLLAEKYFPGRIGIIYKKNKYGEELALYTNCWTLMCTANAISIFLNFPSTEDHSHLKIPFVRTLYSFQWWWNAVWDTAFWLVCNASHGNSQTEHQKWPTGSTATIQLPSGKLLQEKANTPPKDLSVPVFMKDWKKHPV